MGDKYSCLELTVFEVSEHSGAVNYSSTFYKMKLAPKGFLFFHHQILEVNDDDERLEKTTF